MKLINLNTWGGRVYKPFLEFLLEHKDVDIFCFQEIYHNSSKEVVGSESYKDALNLYSNIGDVLKNHKGYFRPSFGENYGLSIFIKKDIHVEGEGDVQIYNVPNYVIGANHSRNLQWVEIDNGNNKLTIVNVHGLWNGKGKGDTEDRLLQSDNIIEFLKKLENPFVLCGDFNLLPETESLKKFERFGLRNLIKENNITSTRTSLYTKEHKMADYIFVSDGIEINDFKVLPHEVSDHNPILIDFE